MTKAHSVSIIIPSFNRVGFLKDTLTTILKQSIKIDEVIVVDDHSTDGTLDFLKRKFEGEIIVLQNKGKGPGAARNTGLEAATGAFIKFFDSDDLMTDNTIEVQTMMLKESEKAFVYSPYFYARENSAGGWETDRVILNYFPFGEQPLWHYMILDGLFITLPGMLFRRELLDEVGPWREDVTASEDWDYLFRLSLVEPHPAHTSACAFLYRLHSAQTTSGNFSNEQRDRDKLKVLMDLKRKFIDTDKRFTALHRLAFQNKFYQSGHSEYVKEGQDFQGSSRWMRPLVSQLLRMRNKIGRLRTHSNWQPCHGPLVSEEKVNHYLSLLQR